MMSIIVTIKYLNLKQQNKPRQPQINNILMRSSCDKIKLKLMHDVLDKQLESINNEPAFKTYDNLRASQDRMKDSIDSRGSVGSRSKNGQFKELTNSAASRKNEINDLERKLMELEKKMECIDLDSSESQNNEKKTAPSASKQNNSAKKREFDRKKQLESYDVKTEEQKQQEQSQQEDSEDNYIPKSINQPVQKSFINNNNVIVKRNQQNKPIKGNNTSFKKLSTTQEDQQNLLGQRYSQKSKRNPSKNASKNQRNSDSFKRSASRNDKQNQNKNILPHVFSNQKSLRHNQSHKSFNSNRSRSRSKSQHKQNSRLSVSVKSMKNQDLQVNREVKRIANLQKQLIHYKRLAQKLQQKVTDMQKIQIEYRKLKTNFAKSEQIRKQQKKLIENLRSRKNQM